MTETPTQSNLPALGRRGGGWVLIQFLLIGALVAAGVRGRGDIDGPLLLAAMAVGCTLIALGSVLIFWGIRALNRSVSPMPAPVANGELVESGPYAYVRHPIYLGIDLVSFGFAVAMDSVIALIVAVIFTVFLDLKSRREESWLRAQYPGYEAYARRVKRLVPYFY